ncbi:MAG: outer membrane beta-barrel protein [Bacteroidales bacterium]|nr:outer membrane beta-barrel protein [Bacteroidales bacterium]
MKKLLLTIILSTVALTGARAQFTHYELTFGTGIASTCDELISRSGIVALNVGPAFHYSFQNMQMAFADNMYLEIFPNLSRRGGRWEQVWQDMHSLRRGYYHAWFLQCPVTVGYKFELPIRAAGHNVGLFVGPAPSVGLFGRYWDRQVTPGYPQADVNYDTDRSPNKKDSHIYKHIRRWDVSLLCGATYRRNNLTVNLYYDHGFAPLLYQEDALISSTTSATTQSGNNTSKGGTSTSDPSTGFADATTRNAFTGTHQALILSLAYHLPLR